MLKLNVGFNRKVGEANYGSRGASVALELEAEGSLAGDPDKLRDRVRQMFRLAKASVDEELNGTATPAGNGQASKGSNGNGGQRADGNDSSGHRASTKQLDYARQLAGQIQGLGVRRLETLAQKMFSKPLADLTSLDASGLIDTLKSIKAGEIDLAAALNGAAS